MSGRPTAPPAPAYTVRTWAGNTNYPAGTDPWSAQPLKVEPPSPAGGFVPDQGAAAEYLNKLFNDTLTALQAAKDFETANAGNATAWMAYLGQLPAFNWRAPLSILTGMTQAKFHAPTRNWLVGGSALIGGAAQFGQTNDLNTWPSSTAITGGQAVLSYAGAFDFDTAGAIVMPGTGATDGVKVSERTSAGTWTKRTAFTNAMVGTDVAFAVTAALWCVAGKRNGTDQIDVWTSPDRINWTARTAPVMPFDAGVGPYCTLASDGAGVLVMQSTKSVTGGASVSFSRSTDGGITWSTPDTHTYTCTANTYFPRPVWTGSQWIAFAFNTTAHTSEVYSSADGLAFTRVATIASVAITSVQAIGELITGMTELGAIVFSIDGGVTWQYTDIVFPSTGSTLLSGGGAVGRFVAHDYSGGNIYVTHASSAGVKQVT